MKSNNNIRDILWSFPLLILLVFFWHIFCPGKALATVSTVAVFSVIVEHKWNLRRRRLFWFTMCVFVGIHLAALFFISFPTVRSGLVAVPIAVMDGFAMITILNWLEKQFLKGC